MEILVRPIHNEEDYEAALSEVDALMDAIPGTPAGDRLNVLSGKRALTLPMVRRLSKGLDLPADVLIQESCPPRSPATPAHPG